MYRRSFLQVVGVGVLASGATGPARAHGRTQTNHTGTSTAQTGTPTATDGFAALGDVPIRGATETVVGGDGWTAFVAATDGVVTVDISDPTTPRILAERRGLLADRARGPLAQVQDVAVDGDRLLVVAPTHSTDKSLAAAVLYDVSDPANPVQQTVVPTGFAVHNADLAGTTAYLTDNGARPRLVVVDMETGTLLGQWSLRDVDDAWTDVSPRLAVVHDVTVRGDRAYVAHWDAGTWMLDVSDPSAPTAVAQIRGRSPGDLADRSFEDVTTESRELPGNDHYVQPGEDGLVAIGSEAWDDDEDGRGGPGGVELWDAKTPTEARRLARVAPPSTADDERDGGWTTAHNFDLVGDRLYTSWYRGGVRVHDVSDPASPALLAAWRWPARTSFWTAQVGVPGEHFVATSRRDPSDPDEPARLFTFPDPLASSRAGASTPESASSEAAGPGFGLATGVVGLGLGAWLARRR